MILYSRTGLKVSREKAQGNHPLLPGWEERAPKLKTKVHNYEMVFHKQLPFQHRKEWDSHSQRKMICPLKPNYNWLNYPSPNLVPGVKWRGQEDGLLSGLALECCWVWWSDGGISIFLGRVPHPGRGGGEGTKGLWWQPEEGDHTVLDTDFCWPDGRPAQLREAAAWGAKSRRQRRSLKELRKETVTCREETVKTDVGEGGRDGDRAEITLSPFSMWVSPLSTLSNI